MKPLVCHYYELLKKDSSLLCPKNQLYGQEVNTFVVSPIATFNSKHWQIRSVKVHGKYRLFPFLLGSATTTWDHPVICSAIKYEFKLDDQSINYSEDYSHYFSLEVPMKVKNPLFVNWDDCVHEKKEKAKFYSLDDIGKDHDLRYNLIGGELSVMLMCMFSDNFFTLPCLFN